MACLVLLSSVLSTGALCQAHTGSSNWPLLSRSACWNWHFLRCTEKEIQLFLEAMSCFEDNARRNDSFGRPMSFRRNKMVHIELRLRVPWNWHRKSIKPRVKCHLRDVCCCGVVHRRPTPDNTVKQEAVWETACFASTLVHNFQGNFSSVTFCARKGTKWAQSHFSLRLKQQRKEYLLHLCGWGVTILYLAPSMGFGQWVWSYEVDKGYSLLSHQGILFGGRQAEQKRLLSKLPEHVQAWKCRHVGGEELPTVK